jgi:hypothetical protein
MAFEKGVQVGKSLALFPSFAFELPRNLIQRVLSDAGLVVVSFPIWSFRV